MIPKNKIYFEEEGHLYFADEARTICVPNFSSIIEVVEGNKFAYVPEQIRQQALDKGTDVHKATQSLDNGEEFTTEYPLYVKQWERFKKDFGCDKFDLIEKPLFSKDLWYACTLDRLYKDVLIDIKTGQVYKDHRVQTACQAIAVDENYGIKVKQRMTVHLTENTYKVEPHDNQKDYYYWKSIVGAFQWKVFEK